MRFSSSQHKNQQFQVARISLSSLFIALRLALYYAFFQYYFFFIDDINNINSTVKRCIRSSIRIPNDNNKRLMRWNHWLASYYGSKIYDVNGKRFCQNQQTRTYFKRCKIRRKYDTTNLMRPDPTTKNNKQPDVIGFILLSLLDEIHHSSYHVYFSIFF